VGNQGNGAQPTSTPGRGGDQAKQNATTSDMGEKKNCKHGGDLTDGDGVWWVKKGGAPQMGAGKVAEGNLTNLEGARRPRVHM